MSKTNYANELAIRVQKMNDFVSIPTESSIINPGTGLPVRLRTRIPVTLTPEFVAFSIKKALFTAGFYDHN